MASQLEKLKELIALTSSEEGKRSFGTASERKLNTVQKIIDFMGQDFVLQEDVLKFFKALTNVVKDVRGELESKTDKQSKDLDDALARFEENTNKILKDAENKSSQSTQNALSNALREISRVEGLILPEADFAPLRAEISEVRELIPEIPDSPTPEKTRDDLESLTGKARLRESAIAGLEERLDKIEAQNKRLVQARVGGMKKITSVREVNLTSQVNGSLKAFTMPSGTLKVIAVYGTQFPVNFNSTTAGNNLADFSFAGNTLTLSAAVGAPKTGQTLFALIETQFFA